MRRSIHLRLMILALFMLLIALACGLGIYHLFFTTEGSGWIVNKYISHRLGYRDIRIGKIKGNLSQTLLLSDVVISGLNELPADCILEIKKLELRVPLFRLKNAAARIDNGRLLLFNKQKILLYGSYANTLLNVNIFANDIDLNTLGELIKIKDTLRFISGTCSSIDVNIKGQLSKPELTGEVAIEKLKHRLLVVSKCEASLNLRVQRLKDRNLLYGDVIIKRGVLSRPKINVAIIILHGIIKFDGDPTMPSFDIKGKTNIEDVDIYINLTGNREKPKLELTSKPAFPPERLLLMLATGKSWKNIDSSLAAGRLSPELIKDFVDFFVFSSSGNEIAKRYGIDITVKYSEDAKGIGMRKSLSKEMEAIYSFEQCQTTDKTKSTNQKLGVDYKVTKDITVEAQKDITKEDKNTGKAAKEKAKTDDKVVIKYKHEF